MLGDKRRAVWIKDPAVSTLSTARGQECTEPGCVRPGSTCKQVANADLTARNADGECKNHNAGGDACEPRGQRTSCRAADPDACELAAKRPSPGPQYEARVAPHVPQISLPSLPYTALSVLACMWHSPYQLSHAGIASLATNLTPNTCQLTGYWPTRPLSVTALATTQTAPRQQPCTECCCQQNHH